MKKTILITALGIALFFTLHIAADTLIDGDPIATAKTGPAIRTDTRRTVEPEAVRRLRDGAADITSILEAKGHCSYASNGSDKRGSYVYVVTVKARSEVVEKEENSDTGEVRVLERRKFLQAEDELSLKDIDIALDLKTVPVEQIHDYGVATANAVALLAAKLGRLETVAVIEATVAAIEPWYRVLMACDGMSARELLSDFGIDELPEPLEKWLNRKFTEMAKKKADDLHFAVQSIKGKSYLITYTQNAGGKPCDVQYESEDHSPISEAEWEILRQANLFLDQDLVPDASPRVGDSWEVWADEVQELFGVAGNCRAEGKIRVKRGPDRGGDWTLLVEPATIRFRDDAGSSAGGMSLTEGRGLVDAKNAYVKTIQATATGDISKMNEERHAMFFRFVKRFRGNAALRFTLVTEPVPAE